MYVTFLAANIKEKLKEEGGCLDRFEGFVGFLGFGAMVYAIVALATGQVNTAELVLLIIYIVLEGFSHIVFIIVIVALALAPLLCCLVLFCACCCMNG